MNLNSKDAKFYIVNGFEILNKDTLILLWFALEIVDKLRLFVEPANPSLLPVFWSPLTLLFIASFPFE